MKIVYTGLEGQGKTLLMAKKMQQILARNKRWSKKYGFVRPVYSNLHLNEELKKKYKNFYFYFDDVKEIIFKTGCDIFHDEISSDFSAMKREPLSRNINRWLRQGSKCGVQYYATAQEYHDIHLDYRRRVSTAYRVKKLIGSERGGKNLPPVKRIWGICLFQEIDLAPYNELQPVYHNVGLFPFIFFGKKLCSIFDTHQEIEASEELPLEHSVKKCLTCGYTEEYHNGRKTKGSYLKK